MHALCPRRALIGLCLLLAIAASWEDPKWFATVMFVHIYFLLAALEDGDEFAESSIEVESLQRAGRHRRQKSQARILGEGGGQRTGDEPDDGAEAGESLSESVDVLNAGPETSDDWDSAESGADRVLDGALVGERVIGDRVSGSAGDGVDHEVSDAETHGVGVEEPKSDGRHRVLFSEPEKQRAYNEHLAASILASNFPGSAFPGVANFRNRVQQRTEQLQRLDAHKLRATTPQAGWFQQFPMDDDASSAASLLGSSPEPKGLFGPDHNPTHRPFVRQDQ